LDGSGAESQQLLAHQLESDPAESAERVRVLHVLDPRNTACQSSVARPEHLALGGTVDEVWQKLLRATDRFIHVDPAEFLDAAVTSEEYVARYGGAIDASVENQIAETCTDA
jgi:hypothetical protein